MCVSSRGWWGTDTATRAQALAGMSGQFQASEIVRILECAFYTVYCTFTAPGRPSPRWSRSHTPTELVAPLCHQITNQNHWRLAASLSSFWRSMKIVSD